MRSIALLLGAGICFSWLQAQEKKAAPKPIPKITMVLNFGSVPGKPSKLTLRGIDLDKATEVVVHEPRCQGKLLGKGRNVNVPGNQELQRVGNTEIDIELLIPQDLPITRVPISLKNESGSSVPHPVVVFDASETRLAEKEPNSEFREAQKLEQFPIIVEGKIQHDRDVDVYQFDGKKGTLIEIDLIARQLGSPAEMMVLLHDSKQTLVLASEVNAETVQIQLPRDSVYYLSLMDANDQGGPTHQYHFRLKK